MRQIRRPGKYFDSAVVVNQVIWSKMGRGIIMPVSLNESVFTVNKDLTGGLKK